MSNPDNYQEFQKILEELKRKTDPDYGLNKLKNMLGIYD